MTLHHSLATFRVLYSLQHHVHFRDKRDYDKQKAVAVVYTSLPGLAIRKTC